MKFDSLDQKNGSQIGSGKETKINPQIILEMVEKYKVPVNPVKKIGAETDDFEYESFTIDSTLKSLANNKHNDCTTTYYLLHKKWLSNLQSASRK